MLVNYYFMFIINKFAIGVTRLVCRCENEKRIVINCPVR